MIALIKGCVKGVGLGIYPLVRYAYPSIHTLLGPHILVVGE